MKQERAPICEILQITSDKNSLQVTNVVTRYNNHNGNIICTPVLQVLQSEDH
jgi:hypothetical protein